MKFFQIPSGVSFTEYYKRLRAEDHPANSFKNEIATATLKSGHTVSNWCSGKHPDMLTQRIIAELTGSTPEELFPVKASKSSK